MRARSKNFKAAGFIFALLIFQGCYFDKEEVLYPGYCNTVQVSYEGQIKLLLQLRCNAPGCHVPGGTGNGDFTSYAGIKEKVDNGSLENRVLVVGDMPEVGDLTECELQQLRAWLESEAPQF